MNKYLFSFSILFALYGCVGAPINLKSDLLNNISIGMSKSGVILKLGQPSRVSTKEGLEYLIYSLVDKIDYPSSYTSFGMAASPTTHKSDYFVKIVDSKVASFGKVGDIGTDIESN